MFYRCLKSPFSGVALVATLALWPGLSAAEGPPLEARPLPVREQAALVRAELVAASLACLKPARLSREMARVRLTGRSAKLARRQLALRAAAIDEGSPPAAFRRVDAAPLSAR